MMAVPGADHNMGIGRKEGLRTGVLAEFVYSGGSPDGWPIQARGRILSRPQIRLARENHSVWQTGSLPPVRPLTIGKIKAGFAIHIMEGIVHGQSAGRLV
jgi:hypothetical protein